jgi:hypothetical protein
MTRAKYTLPIFSGAVATIGLLAACSSGEDSSSAAGPSPKPTTTSSATPAPSASSPNAGSLPKGDSPAPDAGTADASASQSPKTVCQGTANLACFDCCDQHYPAANKTFWGCFCDVAGGLCATECGKDYMCGGDQDSGDACYQCFDQNVATCDDRYAKAMQTTPEIQSYDECTRACPYEPDPQP